MGVNETFACPHDDPTKMLTFSSDRDVSSA